MAVEPLIVEAVVQSGRPADTTLTVPGETPDSPRIHDGTIVQTAYTLKVTGVFRGTDGVVKDGKRIEVRQRGGERDVGDYIESVVDPTFDRLQIGERYVFILKPSVYRDGTFGTATETADGVFQLPAD